MIEDQRPHATSKEILIEDQRKHIYLKEIHRVSQYLVFKELRNFQFTIVTKRESSSQLSYTNWGCATRFE